MKHRCSQGRDLWAGAVVALLLFDLVASDARGQSAAAAEEIIAIASVGGVQLQTRVRRPQGAGPHPLAIINHGSPASGSERPTMEIPTYRPATDWLLSKGYTVALPLRRGYGQTGGRWAENYGSCRNPDYYHAGLATGDDIGAVVEFFRRRSEVKRQAILVIGASAGGWGSVAEASRNPNGVLGILNFAGGRGGHQPRVGNCAPRRLVEAAGRYGSTARIRSLWLYSENDTFFGPKLSRSMFDAYVRGGAPAQYVPLPAFGNDGHRVFNAPGGRTLWQAPADEFLAQLK